MRALDMINVLRTKPPGAKVVLYIKSEDHEPLLAWSEDAGCWFIMMK